MPSKWRNRRRCSHQADAGGDQAASGLIRIKMRPFYPQRQASLIDPLPPVANVGFTAVNRPDCWTTSLPFPDYDAP
jgi:hypothetical protein